MKKKQFYSHILTLDAVHIELEKLDLEDHERQELISYAETTLHHTLLDIVLSELQPEEKKVFLANLHTDNHDELWRHLKEQIADVEEKMREAATTLEASFHEDIKQAKKKK